MIQTVEVCMCVCVRCYGRGEGGEMLSVVVNVIVSSVSGLTGLAAKVARNDSVAILAERRRNEAIASEFRSAA